MIMHQTYSHYTEADQAVWQLLYERQMAQLPGQASEAYLAGITATGFRANRIPDFEHDLNPRLRPLTGWQVQAVEGLIPNRLFFSLLANHCFPATTWLRRRDQLEYLPEPDMFHDTFGHVPMLSNQAFCDFLAALSRLALAHIESEDAIAMIARLYWYTVEFGLIQEPGGLRIYGGGILSSVGETSYSLYSPKPRRMPYRVETLLTTPYIIDHYQEQYFVIESYEQLYTSVPQISATLEEMLAINKVC